MDVDDKNEWRDCVDVRGVKLPTGLHFGASAATGQLAGMKAISSDSNKGQCISLFVVPEGGPH